MLNLPSSIYTVLSTDSKEDKFSFFGESLKFLTFQTPVKIKSLYRGWTEQVDITHVFAVNYTHKTFVYI